ncbi:MAG: triphosphoribosyl-dephospho-CoA synthase [Candidatus Hodarchaeota archaeon]
MDSKTERRFWEIAEHSQFAMLLDILTPKPGNVHRYQDHPDTNILHFAASITRLGHPLYEAAKWGSRQRSSSSEPSQLGKLLKHATQAAMQPHDKNTLLGTILLLVPLAAAAGCDVPQERPSLITLRQNLARILHNTTVEDAVELVRALQIANPGGAIPKTTEWSSKSKAFDFQSPHTVDLIRRQRLRLLDLQALATSYDAIAQEYTSEFAYTFQSLYPQFDKALNRYQHLDDAVLITFLWALSQRPDSFIQRKAGTEAAEKVRQQAIKFHLRVLKMPANRWVAELAPFDEALRAEGSKLNPGTTADLLSAAIFLALHLGNIKAIL